MPTGVGRCRVPVMNIQEIAEQLASTGYIVLDQPLLANLASLLLARCQDDGHERFQAAGICRGPARKHIQAVRGDVISWLDATDSTDHAYLDWMVSHARTGNPLNAGFPGLPWPAAAVGTA